MIWVDIGHKEAKEWREARCNASSKGFSIEVGVRLVYNWPLFGTV